MTKRGKWKLELRVVAVVYIRIYNFIIVNAIMVKFWEFISGFCIQQGICTVGNSRVTFFLYVVFPTL
jgi:hypothetical protein